MHRKLGVVGANDSDALLNSKYGDTGRIVDLSDE